MGVNIKYKGNTIASASGTATKTVKTSGKYCEGDISVELNEVVPSGSLNITQNGTYDVTNKASAVVNVSGDTPVYDTPVITVNASGLVSAAANGKTGTHQLSASDDTDFIAGNIKDGVTLFGILGTLAGGGGGLRTVTGTFVPPSSSYGIVTHNLNTSKSVFVFYNIASQSSITTTNSAIYGFAYYDNGDRQTVFPATVSGTTYQFSPFALSLNYGASGAKQASALGTRSSSTTIASGEFYQTNNAFGFRVGSYSLYKNKTYNFLAIEMP